MDMRTANTVNPVATVVGNQFLNVFFDQLRNHRVQSLSRAAFGADRPEQSGAQITVAAVRQEDNDHSGMN